MNHDEDRELHRRIVSAYREERARERLHRAGWTALTCAILFGILYFIGWWMT